MEASRTVDAIKYGFSILFQFLIVVALLGALAALTWALFWCDLARGLQEGFEGERVPYDPYLSNLLLQLYLDLQSARHSVPADPKQDRGGPPVELDAVHYDQFKRLALHLLEDSPPLDRFDRELAPRLQLLLAQLMRPLFAQDQLKHEFLLDRFLQSRRDALLRAAYATPTAPGPAAVPAKIA